MAEGGDMATANEGIVENASIPQDSDALSKTAPLENVSAVTDQDLPTTTSRRSTRNLAKEGSVKNGEKKFQKPRAIVVNPDGVVRRAHEVDIIEKTPKGEGKLDRKIKVTQRKPSGILNMSVADDLCINVESIVNVMPTLAPCLQAPSIPLKGKERRVDYEGTGRKYTCIVCSETFDKKPHLVNHMRAHSSNKGGYTCSICNKSCNTLSNLRAHRQTHSEERPFQCSKCDAQFKVKSYLKRHMFSHSEIKQFTCERCNKNFTHKGSLKHHAMIHTGEKPHKCTHCDKSFLHTSSLKSHEASHTGIKPFVCEICKKGFPRMYGLKIHKLSHSKEKPFQCEVCSKGFKRRDHLREHLVTHSQEKPYKCETCGKTFSQNICLRKHLPCREHERYQRRNDATTRRDDRQFSQDNQTYQSGDLIQQQVILATEPNIMYYGGEGGEVDQLGETQSTKADNDKVASPTAPLLPFVVQDQVGSVIDPSQFQLYTADLSGTRVVFGATGNILMQMPSQWQAEDGMVSSETSQDGGVPVSNTQSIASRFNSGARMVYTDSMNTQTTQGVSSESSHNDFTVNVDEHSHPSVSHSQEELRAVPGIDSLSRSGITRRTEETTQWVPDTPESSDEPQDIHIQRGIQDQEIVNIVSTSKDGTVPHRNVQLSGVTGHSDLSQVLFNMIEDTGTLQQLDTSSENLLFTHSET